MEADCLNRNGRVVRQRSSRDRVLSSDQVREVVAHLDPDLAVGRGSCVDHRMAGPEVLTRQWQHAAFKGGWLRLEPGETKNREGRMFPLFPAVRAILEEQRERVAGLDAQLGKIIPSVFPRPARSGRRIVDIRIEWRDAAVAAGLPGRIPHDFRRTAVRNLERAGVSRSASMRMVGHQTEAIYRRYAIVAERDLQEAGGKLQALHDQAPPGKVRRLEKRP